MTPKELMAKWKEKVEPQGNGGDVTIQAGQGKADAFSQFSVLLQDQMAGATADLVLEDDPVLHTLDAVGNFGENQPKPRPGWTLMETD